MKNIEHAITKHYGGKDLLTRIYTGLEASGIDKDALQSDDLIPVDEFHIGGRKATEYAVAKLFLNEKHHVIDIGCGIGGTSRYIASQTGSTVTGIDLTPEYISIAKELTELTGLKSKINYELGNALSMPFEDETFDAAITIHVAMNIQNRVVLYREIARVMKPGTTLSIFDVMKKNDDSITFPVPWSETLETSHLVTPEEMQLLLHNAGFKVHELEDRTEFALNFFKQATASSNKPAPLGLHLVLGENAGEKLKNVKNNISNGCIIPMQIIAKKN